MRTVLVFVVILATVPIIAFIAMRYFGPRSHVAVPPDVDPDTFRNHQQMARMLDNIIHDDFISGVIPTEQKQQIRQVLIQYYDNPQIGNK